MKREDQHLHIVSTSWGDIAVQLKDDEVIGCALPHLKTLPSKPFTILENHTRHPAVRFIIDTLQGRRGELPPLAIPKGSSFQKQVWAVLMKIPAGETRSYAEVAKTIGKPTACRAVANACGKNPLPLFIPCHRVIGSDGTLHGFSAGTPWKQLLLSAESRCRI